MSQEQPLYLNLRWLTRVLEVISIFLPSISSIRIHTNVELSRGANRNTIISKRETDCMVSNSDNRSSQIEWYLNASASIKLIERPFQPDGAADLDKIWRRRSQPSRQPAERQDRHLAKPNAMMWFHIPLQEAYNEADSFNMASLDVGSQLDSSGASKHNSGFFYNGIKEAFESPGNGDGSWFNQKTTEVKVLSHGHCHNTDRCRRADGIW